MNPLVPFPSAATLNKSPFLIFFSNLVPLVRLELTWDIGCDSPPRFDNIRTRNLGDHSVLLKEPTQHFSFYAPGIADFVLFVHPRPSSGFLKYPSPSPCTAETASQGCPQLAEHRQVFESTCSGIQQMVMFPNKVMWSMTLSCLGGLKCLLMLNSRKASDIAQESKGTSAPREDSWAMQKKRTM